MSLSLSLSAFVIVTSSKNQKLDLRLTELHFTELSQSLRHSHSLWTDKKDKMTDEYGGIEDGLYVEERFKTIANHLIHKT